MYSTHTYVHTYVHTLDFPNSLPSLSLIGIPAVSSLKYDVMLQMLVKSIVVTFASLMEY